MISKYTVQHVTKEDILNPTLKEILELFDRKIKEKLADQTQKKESCPENKFFHEDIILDEKKGRKFDTEVPDADNYKEEVMDDLIFSKVKLQHNGLTVKANIIKRYIVPDRKPIVKYNQNPILDSIKYEVELPDGVVDEYYQNIISNKLLSQVDKEGRVSKLMKDKKIDKSAIKEWKKGLIKKKYGRYQ